MMSYLIYEKSFVWQSRQLESKAFMAGKYVEDVVQNFKEAERKKEDRKEIQKILGYSRIGNSSNKY